MLSRTSIDHTLDGSASADLIRANPLCPCHPWSNPSRERGSHRWTPRRSIGLFGPTTQDEAVAPSAPLRSQRAVFLLSSFPRALMHLPLAPSQWTPRDRTVQAAQQIPPEKPAKNLD